MNHSKQDFLVSEFAISFQIEHKISKNKLLVRCFEIIDAFQNYMNFSNFAGIAVYQYSLNPKTE